MKKYFVRKKQLCDFDEKPQNFRSKSQLLCIVILQMEVVVGKLRNTTPAGRACQEADLHQIGLVDVLQRDGLLADGRRERLQADGAAAWSAASRVMTPS